MFPILEVPTVVSDVFNRYRDVFCREEGFAWVSRYVTGLLVSPNKTVQGIYDLHVNVSNKIINFKIKKYLFCDHGRRLYICRVIRVI